MRRGVGAVSRIAGALGCCGVLAACGLGTGGGYSPTGTLGGPVADVDLDGLDVAVGSKNFTEQYILGKIAVILLGSAGADVTDLTGVPGSSSTRQALVNSDMDMMFEYTGTAWITYMGESDPIPDEHAQYQAVRDRDAAENDLVWLPPAPMNNTYGLAVRAETAQQYGVQSLADIGDVPEEKQTYCIDAEFKARNDGFEPMLDAYGLPAAPDRQIAIMDSGAIYAGIADGTCTLGEVFHTDGRIPALDLQVLDDPKDFFPKYNMAPVVRGEVAADYPQLAELFRPVTEDLTDERMQQLNARVDVDGEDYTQVAWDYLEERGLVS